MAIGQPQTSRPNIIVVMGDDHAQWAMGAYGLEQIRTPSLDWIADRGVIFRNAMSSTGLFARPGEFSYGQDAVATWCA